MATLSVVVEEVVVLPERAVVALPSGYDFAQASTLPIAALTAWSVLRTEGQLASGQTVLTLNDAYDLEPGEQIIISNLDSFRSADSVRLTN